MMQYSQPNSQAGADTQTPSTHQSDESSQPQNQRDRWTDNSSFPPPMRLVLGRQLLRFHTSHQPVSDPVIVFRFRDWPLKACLEAQFMKTVDVGSLACPRWGRPGRGRLVAEVLERQSAPCVCMAAHKTLSEVPYGLQMYRTRTCVAAMSEGMGGRRGVRFDVECLSSPTPRRLADQTLKISTGRRREHVGIVLFPVVRCEKPTTDINTHGCNAIT
ncbi:hypothetical protein QBC39DRAFT_171631 [Podospora conica]|nr:hypothetical protein QBC39DRAFT_171631 [Schizothecium conicum]